MPRVSSTGKFNLSTASGFSCNRRKFTSPESTLILSSVLSMPCNEWNVEQRMYRQFTGQSSIDCGGRERERARKSARGMHVERTRHLFREKKKKKKKSALECTLRRCAAANQPLASRTCARRLFRSESCFSCARARVLFVQKVALGEREL